MKISRFFIFILASTITNFLSAQFFGTQRRSQFFYTTALHYPSDTNFRVIAMGANAGFWAQSRIFTYNQQMQIIDSVSLLKGVICQRNEPLKVGSSLFWAATFYDTLQSVPGSLAILELDTLYHHKTLHIASTANEYIYQAVNICHINEHFYIGVVKNYYSSSVLYRLNSQFSKVDSIEFDDVSVQYGMNDLHQVNSQLVVSLNGNSQLPCPGKSNSILKGVYLDSLLGQTGCTSYDSVGNIKIQGMATQKIFVRGFPFYSSKILPISATKNFVLGLSRTSYPSLDSHWSLVSSVCDNTGKPLATVIATNSTQDHRYHDDSNFADVKGNMLVSVGSKGYDFTYPYIAQPQSTEIIVIRMDTTGQHLWTKSYGGDMFYYPNSIIFTRDSGMLVAGWRYDYKTMKDSTVWESFLLRLDKNGNVTVSNPAGINESFNESDFIVFPNPALDYLSFTSSFSITEVDILDLQGRTVSKHFPGMSGREIPMDKLSPGSYFVRAMTNEGKFFYRKLQKE